MSDIKKSIVACAVSLVACCALLVGVSFAWFTDSVENKGNKISAGAVEIQLNDGESHPVLQSDALWEPGMAQTATVKLTNGVDAPSVKISLQVAMTEADAVNAAYFDVSWRAGDSLNENPLGTLDGLLDAPAEILTLNRGESKTFFLIVRMWAATGNEAQGINVAFDLNIKAVQNT